MKIALVHDYLKEYGGAEKVLEALSHIWPPAPIYTAFSLPSKWGVHRQRLEKTWRHVHTSWAQKLPLKDRLTSHYTAISPLFFENFNFNEYDVVFISSTGAYFPRGIVVKPQTLVINYCHTPPRFLYGLPAGNLARKKLYWRPLSAFVNSYLRVIDFNFAQRPDCFIANSQNVANRITKFYRRDSSVIYPPCDIGDKAKSKPGGEFYLFVSRLSRSKRPDLAIKAANHLQLPLKVIGKPIGKSTLDQYRRLAGPTVEILGEVTDQELDRLYREAAALIFPSEQEDFGIAPVEAMGRGTPVIALRAGGPLETIIEAKTGQFFDRPTTTSLVKLLKNFKPQNYSPAACRHQAQKFSQSQFKAQIKQFVKTKYQEHQNSFVK